MPTNRTSRSPRRSLLICAATCVGALALLGACSDENGNPLVSLPDVSLPEAPETTEAPEAPETTEAPETPADDEGLSTEDWVLLAILGFAVIAVIVWATAAAEKRSAKKPAARDSLNSRLSHVSGMSRWVLDQASVEIMRMTDPAQLRAAWDGTRPRFVELESEIVVFAGSTGDSVLDQSLSMLGQSVAGVRGALDTLVSLRTGEDAVAQQALIDDAVRTVQERRQQLSTAIAPVQAARV